MRPYQKKLQGSMDERWSRISAAIPPQSKTLLDIGANLGAFTAWAAQAGLWSLGLERHDYLVRKARRMHRDVPGCAFMITELDADDCARIPQFDITLALSVYHNWYKNYGKEQADTILKHLVSKTNHVAFFEGPSRNSRFGEDAQVGFADNDEASVTGFYGELLQETIGALASKIELLGKTACVGEREPYRWMYAVYR